MITNTTKIELLKTSAVNAIIITTNLMISEQSLERNGIKS